MRKEFDIKDAKIVYSKGELGYQEVLEHFLEANKILILTYNISEYRKELIEQLKKRGNQPK